MSNLHTAKWIEINIGDSTNSGSDTILRFTESGSDVEYDSNTYLANGELSSIGTIENTLSFKKTSLTIKLSSANLTNVAHFNAFKYRNKPVSVWIAKRNTDGSIDTSTIKQIFKGQCDSHSVSRKTINLKAQSLWARFEQIAGSRTSAEDQKYNIENSVYDVATNTVDKGFDLADVDYSNITLGKIPLRSVTTEIDRPWYNPFGHRKFVTTQIPGREGASLSDDGSDYTKEVVFGRANVTGNLIYAFNPTQANVASVYSTLATAPIVSGVTEDTKYLSMLFAVAEGEVDDVSVMFNSIVEGATVSSFALADGSTGNITDADDNVVGVIEVKTGKDNQTAISNLVSLSGEWTTNHRCIGTALVLITVAASEVFGAGFPDFGFNVGGKFHKEIEYISATNTYAYKQVPIPGYYGNLPDTFARPFITIKYIVSTTPAKTVITKSASPAYAILDVLTDKSYGLGQSISADDIDLGSFKAAYDNEQDVSSAQAGEYITSCRGVLSGVSFKEMIDSLLQVAKANLTILDGKITLIPNKYLGTDAVTKAASKTFDEDNIIGGIQDIKFAPSNRVFNKITMSAPVSNSVNNESFSLLVEDRNALADDNGQKSEKIMSVPMASVQYDQDGNPEDSSREVLEEIGRYELRRSRLFVRGRMMVNYWDNTTLKPGDIINISSKRYNLTGSGTILAKVTKVLFKKQGILEVHWRQYSNLIYDVSQTDITTVSRGSFPAESFNTPANYSPNPALDGDTIDLNADGQIEIKSVPVALIDGDVASTPVIIGTTGTVTAGITISTNELVIYNSKLWRYLGTEFTTTAQTTVPSEGALWNEVGASSGGGSGEANVQADWDETTTSDDAFIKNKPTIPTVNNGTITIRVNSSDKGSFTTNQSSNETIDLGTISGGDGSFDAADARDALAISDSSGTLTYKDASDATQTYTPTDFPDFVTAQTYSAGALVEALSTQWRATAAVDGTSANSMPIEGQNWSEIATKSDVSTQARIATNISNTDTALAYTGTGGANTWIPGATPKLLEQGVGLSSYIQIDFTTNSTSAFGPETGFEDFDNGVLLTSSSSQTLLRFTNPNTFNPLTPGVQTLDGTTLFLVCDDKDDSLAEKVTSWAGYINGSSDVLFTAVVEGTTSMRLFRDDSAVWNSGINLTINNDFGASDPTYVGAAAGGLVAGVNISTGEIVQVLENSISKLWQYIGSSTLTTISSTPLPSEGALWTSVTTGGGGGGGASEFQASPASGSVVDIVFSKSSFEAVSDKGIRINGFTSNYTDTAGITDLEIVIDASSIGLFTSSPRTRVLTTTARSSTALAFLTDMASIMNNPSATNSDPALSLGATTVDHFNLTAEAIDGSGIVTLRLTSDVNAAWASSTFSSADPFGGASINAGFDSVTLTDAGSATSSTVAGQVFSLGDIVYFDGDAYMYFGTSTLTTTTSSALPSAGGDWKKLTP